MRFSEFEHVIGAAADVTTHTTFVVVGSQAILGTTPDPPPELLASMEVDVYVPGEPDAADEIDGVLGDGSQFHTTFGFYAHGVGPGTAKAPVGWEDRLTRTVLRPRPGRHHQIVARCLEVHDLVLSKVVAGRQRDWDYARNALAAGLVRLETLLERVDDLPVRDEQRPQIRAMLRRAANEADR